MRQARSFRWLLAACALLAVFVVPSAAHAATPCADLYIDSINLNPDPPIAGTKTTVEITVTNGGTCTAPGFVVQWRQDQNSKTGPNKSVASLGAGESRTVTVSSDFTYPAAGNYLSRAEVDTGKAVNEYNEVNNLEIRSITVQKATRDLVVSSFSVDPQPVVRGDVATATIEVTNQGNSPTGTFRIDWTPYVGALPLTKQVNGLGPGESTTVTYDYTYRFTGNVTSTATVDKTKRVVETNENNNTSTLKYVVEPPLPDLEVTDISQGPDPIVAGQNSTTDVTVSNTGNRPSGAFILSWKPSATAPALTQQVNALDVGESQVVSFDYTYPTAGTFTGTATADSTKVVPEVSETNNTRTTSTTIQASQVDLTVTDIRIECAGRDDGGIGFGAIRPNVEGSCQHGDNPVQGEPIYAVVTVQNLGNAPSGRFTTEWNPDTFDIIPQGPHTVSEETDPLGPGESREIRMLYTYPLAGNFRTIANVDVFNTEKESNETNNKKILNLVVDPAPIDLQITDFTIDPAQPVRGIPATASITVVNTGPLATGPFNVQWKPRTNGGFPVTARSVGLNPGESQTFTLQSTYPTKGDFQTSATVDSSNQVVEPYGGEDNNTVTKPVTVVPQETTLNVKLSKIHVVNDGDGGGFGNPQGSDAEWRPMVLGVFDPKAHCTLSAFGQNLDTDGFACKTLPGRDGVNDGDDLTFGAGEADIDVKLVESTPLLFGFLAIDTDNSIVGPDFPDPRGAVFQFSKKPDYLSLAHPLVLKGQGCTDNDGYCFDAYFDVTVKASNVPGVQRAAARAALARASAPLAEAPAEGTQADALAVEAKVQAFYDSLVALHDQQASSAR